MARLRVWAWCQIDFRDAHPCATPKFGRDNRHKARLGHDGTKDRGVDAPTRTHTHSHTLFLSLESTPYGVTPLWQKSTGPRRSRRSKRHITMWPWALFSGPAKTPCASFEISATHYAHALSRGAIPPICNKPATPNTFTQRLAQCPFCPSPGGGGATRRGSVRRGAITKQGRWRGTRVKARKRKAVVGKLSI